MLVTTYGKALVMMDAVTALLKHLRIGRSVVFALFPASSVAFLGPKVFPQFLMPLPVTWQTLSAVVMTFTGGMSVIWSMTFLKEAVGRVFKSVYQAYAARELSEHEEALLGLIAGQPGASINLEPLTREHSSLRHLKLLALSAALERKGLSKSNPWDENLVSLTARGRKRALELQQKRLGKAS